MQIVIDGAERQSLLDTKQITELLTHVFLEEGLPDTYEVSVSFVDEEKIHELNREYRGIDRPTDVLSFAIDAPDEFDDGGVGADHDGGDAADDGLFEGSADELFTPMLGDIIICPQIVERQAPAFGNSPADELRLLLVHGALHLMGYDHESPEEAEDMEALERSYLAPFATVPAEALNIGPTVDHAAEGSLAP